jgi:hypothetical protein
VQTLQQLYALMFVKSMVFVMYEPSKTAYLSTMGKPQAVGAYVGWMHCMKGFASVTSGVLGGWLSGEGIALPYTLTGVIICFDALLIWYFRSPAQHQLASASATAGSHGKSGSSSAAATDSVFSPSLKTKNVQL